MLSHRVIVAVFFALLSQGFIVSAAPGWGARQHYARSEQLGGKISSRDVARARRDVALHARAAEYVHAAPHLSSLSKRDDAVWNALTTIGTVVSTGAVTIQGIRYYKNNPGKLKEHVGYLKVPAAKAKELAKSALAEYKRLTGGSGTEAGLAAEIEATVWVDPPAQSSSNAGAAAGGSGGSAAGGSGHSLAVNSGSSGRSFQSAQT